MNELQPGDVILGDDAATRVRLGYWYRTVPARLTVISNKPTYPRTSNYPYRSIEVVVEKDTGATLNTLDSQVEFGRDGYKLLPMPLAVADARLDAASLAKLRIATHTGDPYRGPWGCDPEFFLFRGGKPWPAWKTFVAAEDKGRSAITPYWDGYQAEFQASGEYKGNNTCLAYMVDTIRDCLSVAHKKAKADGTELAIRDIVEVPPAELREYDTKYTQFGCKPSHNVYNLTGLAINDSSPFPLRFAGGHIHIGYLTYRHSDYSHYNPEQIVRACDRVAGLMSIAIFGELEDRRRRLYYGLPGEYRLPKHGVEYRTLSPYWLMSPITTHLMFEIMRTAVGIGGSELYDHYEASDSETIAAIADSDAELARTILHRNWKMLGRLFRYRSAVFDDAVLLEQLVWNGIGSYRTEPISIENAWGLDSIRTDYGHDFCFQYAERSYADKSIKTLGDLTEQIFRKYRRANV